MKPSYDVDKTKPIAAAISLIATSLLISACSNSADTTPAAADTDATLVAEEKTSLVAPGEWTSLEEMQSSLNDLTGQCDELGTMSGESGGYCSADGTILFLGVNADQTLAVKLAAISSDVESEGYVVWKDDWSVYCAATRDDSLPQAEELCTQIENAIPGSKLVNAESSDKIEFRQSDSESEMGDDTEDNLEDGSFKDGTHLVGTDIQPGMYRNQGTERCYWERLSGLSGESSDILANDNPTGQAYIEILPSDRAFNSKRCGTWELAE